MPATKLLYSVVVMVVLLAVVLFFVIFFNQEAGGVRDEALEDFKNSAMCNLALFDNSCSKLSEGECKLSPDCVLCDRRNPDTSVVSTCEIAICGCDPGWDLSPGNFVFWLDKDSYYIDDTIKVKGRLITDKPLESPPVRLSFADASKNSIPSIPGTTVIGAADDKGNYEWNYKIPEEVDDGVYFLRLEYEGTVYFMDLRIYQVPEQVEGGEKLPVKEPEVQPPEEKPPAEEIEPPVAPPAEPEKPEPPASQLKLKAILVQHGSAMSDSELDELANFAEDGIRAASEGIVELDITVGKIIPLPKESEKYDYSKVRSMYPWLSDDSVPRVWYFEFGGGNKVKEQLPGTVFFEDVKKAAVDSGFDPTKYDFPIVLTEAQMSPAGIHFSKSKTESSLIIIKQPDELQYTSESFHTTRVETKYMLTDTIIHEVGHFMSLGHHCQTTRCDQCKSGTDVMTYCWTADRPGPLDTDYRTYGSCSLSIIKSKIPDILSPDYIPTEIVCEDKK